MSVAEDCATIRAALPVLRAILLIADRPCSWSPDAGTGDTSRRRWSVATALRDGRHAVVRLWAAGGNGIVVSVDVRDGALWSRERIGRGWGPARTEAMLSDVRRKLDALDREECRREDGEPDDCSDCWAPVEAVQP